MRLVLFGVSAATLTSIAALTFSGCASSAATCADDSTCPGSPNADAGDGSVGPGDAQPDVVAPPAGCDPTADPKDAPKCVVSDYGIFVDATSGLDTNAGTPDAPVRLISTALGLLKGKPRIYVCEGNYTEKVALASAVSIYGGFACKTWTYSGNKAVFKPTDTGAAITVTGTTSEVVLADLDVTAADGKSPGDSSIGIFAANASRVGLTRMKIAAGLGANGQDAADKSDFSPSSGPPGKNGTDSTAPGQATPNPDCTTSVGGAGGDATGDATDNGMDGKVKPPSPSPASATGAGGTTGGTCGTGNGTIGSNGAGGSTGAGATTLGTFTENGWAPTSGADGGNGVDGQGGGGGARLAGLNIGGAGAPGGCGGAGGGKGQGGGASIGVASFQSTLILDAVTTIATGVAGNGGRGAKGQKAQLGGTGGTFPNQSQACNGGQGGIGGSGGGGGGGAGGLSVGVFYKGSPPSIGGQNVSDAPTQAGITLGTQGAVGAAGGGGDPAQSAAPVSNPGTAGTPGVAGVAKAVMAAP